MKTLKGNIDVPAVVAKPEVYIISHSSSSTEDQQLFVETRRECLKQTREIISTTTQVEVHDVLRGGFMEMGQLPSLRHAINKVGHTVVLAAVLTVAALLI